MTLCHGSQDIKSKKREPRHIWRSILRLEEIGSPFPISGTRLRFKEDQLEFKVCVTMREGSTAREYLLSGVWIEGSRKIADEWKATHCWIQGYDEWPLFGDWELMEVRRPYFFPVAIVAYNHVTRDVSVLVKKQRIRSGLPERRRASANRETLSEAGDGARADGDAGL